MKKSSIVKEYNNFPVHGIYNMQEKSNFLCSKMMDIEDEIRISYNFTPNSIIDNNSTVNNEILKSLNNISYNTIKEDAIILNIDKTQTEQESNNLTKWVFNFDSKKILREYLYNEIYTLNPYSPFKQINSNILNNIKISTLCYDYIDKNILNRYKLKSFILWTAYYELKNNIVPGSGGNTELNPSIKLLYKTPTFSILSVPNTSTTNTVTSDIDNQKEAISLKEYNNGEYEIYYKQTRSSQYYTFLWYYDVIFEKI